MNEIVLIAEADLMLVEDLGNFLALEGYEVWSANNGVQALTVLEERYATVDLLPDCIVSAVRMPIMQGLDFLEATRNHPCWQNIPFVLLTNPGETTHNWLHRRKYDAQLTKPFAMHDFAQIIWDQISKFQRLKAQ